MTPKSRKRWTLLLKLALTATALAFVAQKIDIHTALAKLKDMNPLFLVLGLGVMFIQMLIAAERWRLVMIASGESLSFRLSVKITFLSSFFNLFLPGVVGSDAVRVWKAHDAGQGLQAAFNGVLLERLISLYGLVLLVSLTQPILAARTNALAWQWGFPAATIVGTIGLVGLLLIRRLPQLFARMPGYALYEHLSQTGNALIQRPVQAFLVLFYAMLAQAFLSLVVYTLAVGLGTPLSLLDCVVLVPPVILLMTVPISIAGWGVREGGMIYGLGLVGIEPGVAVTISILFGVLTILAALPGGLLLHMPASHIRSKNSQGM